MTEKTSRQTQTQHDSERQAQESQREKRMQQIGFKLLVLSGKGGVGKSTVAANMALSLALQGKAVGLLDVDVHGPSIPKLLGLEGREVRSNGHAMVPVNVQENLEVMSMGFMLASKNEPVVWRGPMKYNAIRQFLGEVAWGRLDYLVIDSPPGTGDEPLTVAQLVGSPAGAVIVTTPQDLAIADVRRCVSFCNAVSLAIVGIVENMSGYVCPKCGHETDLFKAGGGSALAAEMGVPFLGQIPIDPEIVSSGDAGTPFVRGPAKTPGAKAFDSVVRAVLAATE
jgi:ATP-binding protein involved in chromosome partitioning